MCGYNGEEFTTSGNCPNGLICTGAIESDPEAKRAPSFRKEQLCSRGSSSFWLNYQKIRVHYIMQTKIQRARLKM